MNRYKQIEGIRRRCIEANPSIVDEYDITENGGAYYGYTSYPRPIRLADVLLAIGSEKSEAAHREYWVAGDYFYVRQNRTMKWNLRRDDLTQQPDETIEFVQSVLLG